MRYPFLAVFVVTLGLTGCVTPAHVMPQAAAVTVEPVHHGDMGLYFDDENKAYIVGKGVPAAWFTRNAKRPDAWYLTRLQVIQAADIMRQNRNKLPK